MDIISGMPGCAGQAADAVSAYTQVKMEDAPKLLKVPKSKVQTFGFVYHVANGQNHGPVWKTQSILLSEICMLILWHDCYGNDIRNRLFLSVYVDDIKLAGKKQNVDPMWKVLNKEFDSGEPTSFLDHVYLACTQRQCEISKDIVDNNRTMFESRISEEATEKLPWRVMPRNVWNDIVSWQTKRLNNSTKYQLHALTTIISKKEKKWNPWENCQKYALKLF